jgi:hypothetical protein
MTKRNPKTRYKRRLLRKKQRNNKKSVNTGCNAKIYTTDIALNCISEERKKIKKRW